MTFIISASLIITRGTPQSLKLCTVRGACGWEGRDGGGWMVDAGGGGVEGQVVVGSR